MSVPCGKSVLVVTLGCVLVWAGWVRAEPPRSVAGMFSGASQMSHWYSANGDTVDAGFTGPQASKSGLTVWQEELRRFLPDLSIHTGYQLKANVGFIGHWWATSGGLTRDGAAVRDGLIQRMRSDPQASGFVCHVLSSAAYHEGEIATLRAELVGYATALKEAVDSEFGAGQRDFTFWWMEAGNRWNNPAGGQGTASARRRLPLQLAGLEEHDADAATLPSFRVTPTVMAYVIGDWKDGSSDGTHYTRVSSQRAGRQLAYSMLLAWGAPSGPITRELAIDSAWRDPGDPRAFFVKVQTSGGQFIGSKQPCRVSTASGHGVDVGNQGIIDGSKWTMTIDNSTAERGYSLVRMERATDLPAEDLFFSHTWGTWHTVTPGRSGSNYRGPVAVWHEDLSGGNGMTQDFADLTASPRSIIMTLGSAQVVPIRASASKPITLHTLAPANPDPRWDRESDGVTTGENR